MFLNFRFLVIIIAITFFTIGCKLTEEPKSVPVVQTNSSNEISSNSAKVYGAVVEEGSSATNERGIVYSSQNPLPSTSDLKIISGFGKGEYSVNLSNLLPNTKYFFRAYAVNSIGIGYGAVRDFTTIQAKTPIVSTNSATNITINSFTTGGIITSDGGSSIIERGVVYSLSQNPTTLNSKITSTSNQFSIDITGLNDNTTYYCRAFATNAVGTTYGDQIIVTTLKNFNNSLKNGLVAYYPFNGGSNDMSGNGYNGKVNNVTLTTDRKNQLNAAYLFNKSSIDLGSLPLLGNSPVSFTKSVWILAETNQNTICKMPILSKRQANGDSWITFGGGGNGTVGVPWNAQAYLFVDKSDYTSGITNSSFSKTKTNDGKWHHLVAVKENATLKIYFDGVLESSIIDNTTISSSSNMVIGYQAMWGFECEKYFFGKIDDVGIWNRALTAEEIKFLFEKDFNP